jgi:hypothetical protein
MKKTVSPLGDDIREKAPVKSIQYILTLLLLTAASAAAAEEDSAMEKRFRKISKGTAWKTGESWKADFRTYHPQGLTAAGDRFFLSSVEVIERAADRGTGHLFEMSREGKLLREITLGKGACYHPGGIDFDGTEIWVSVAAYRPDSASIVYAVDPESLEYREVFRFNDHLGAIAHFPEWQFLVAVSWGSRRFYRWKTAFEDEKWTVPDPENPVMKPNGAHYIDYQDMQRIPGTPYLLCSGFQSYSPPGIRLPALRLGGIDLVHVEELTAHHQVPVPVRPPAMPAWTQNPFYVERMEKGLRFFFLPEDNRSLLHTLEVEVGND